MVIFNADGSYVYTPQTDFVGTDFFTYQTCDASTPPACDTASATITVLPSALLALVDSVAGVINGYAGSTNVLNVLTNDLLMGLFPELPMCQ